MITRPKNLLYANTDSFIAAPTRKPTTRKVRSRVPASTQKIGVIDFSAKAGLLFHVLDRVNRKQNSYTFYPVEAPLPMGLGVISESIVEDFAREVPLTKNDRRNLLNNVIVESFMPLLAKTREAVAVDQMVGLVAPMLASSRDNHLRSYNYYSMGEGNDILVSAFDMREYARDAKRPFEAAMSMLVVAQSWSLTFGIKYHDETRGCIFDHCANRSDVVAGFRSISVEPECLARIPHEKRDDVLKCLDAIREYRR